MIDVGHNVTTRSQRRSARVRRFLPLSLLAVDLISIYVAFYLAYALRYSFRIGPRIHDQLAFDAYTPIALFLIAVMIPVLLLKGAYRLRLSTEISDEFTTVFSAGTISVAAIVVGTYMAQKYQYSRGVVLYVWVLVIVLVSLGRALHRHGQGRLYRHGWAVQRLVVAGASDLAITIMQSVMNRPDLGFHLVGFVGHRETPQVRDFGRFRALGTVSDLPSLIEDSQVDEIIVALPASAHEEVLSIVSLCERHGVGLKLVPDLFEMSLSRVQVDDISGIPLLDVQDKPIRRLARFGKRCIDIVLGALVLVLSLPLLATLALLIRLESPGPAFLRQERVGLGGRTFQCLKLRTMRMDAEEMEPLLFQSAPSDMRLFKLRDDPRCTRVGRRIRRWSLDELPQVWNVLMGDMSLVGPRPPLPSQAAKYEPKHWRRLDVKPGMTGLWQVSGRSDLSFDEMVHMDIYYVENWTLPLDVKLMVRTIIAVLGRQGAY